MEFAAYFGMLFIPCDYFSTKKLITNEFCGEYSQFMAIYLNKFLFVVDSFR